MVGQIGNGREARQDSRQFAERGKGDGCFQMKAVRVEFIPKPTKQTNSIYTRILIDSGYALYDDDEGLLG